MSEQNKQTLEQENQNVNREAEDEVLDAEVVENGVSGAASQADETGVLQQEVDNLKSQLLRTHADFDNFRKRTRQEKEDLQLYATRKLLEDLLPIVDNFERALESIDSDASEVKTGIEMVHRQFLGALEKYGVRGMDVVGEAFNPNLHEAVMQEPADGKEVGVVTAQLQKGYMIHEKVLRPAMVRVTV